jgi:hypothetical protein
LSGLGVVDLTSIANHQELLGRIKGVPITAAGVGVVAGVLAVNKQFQP